MKILKLTSTILLLLFMASCEDQNIDGYNSFYGGNHELRKFSSQEKVTAANGSASYFLFWGSASINGEEKTSVIAFSWKSKNGEFILTKIPMSKVRVKFDNNNSTPYVTFSVETPIGNHLSNPDTNVEYAMEYQLNYVVVHCKESDYPSDIKINDIR